MKYLVLCAIVFLASAPLSESQPPLISWRIYGGDDAYAGVVPYIVSIQNRREHICGGSIIAANWVVTSAHCVIDQSNLVVVAGILKLRSKDSNAQQIAIEEIIFPAEYDSNSQVHDIANDIALLRLAENLTFNDYVKPIVIMTPQELEATINENATAIIAGWGSSEESLISKSLKIAAVSILTTEECLQDIQEDCHKFNPEAHLCSGPITGPKRGVGFFDDGGPLEINDKLVGLILHADHINSNDNCHKSSIYTKITHHWNFIMGNIPEIAPIEEEKEKEKEKEQEKEQEQESEKENENETENDPSKKCGSEQPQYRFMGLQLIIEPDTAPIGDDLSWLSLTMNYRVWLFNDSEEYKLKPLTGDSEEPPASSKQEDDNAKKLYISLVASHDPLIHPEENGIFSFLLQNIKLDVSAEYK